MGYPNEKGPWGHVNREYPEQPVGLSIFWCTFMSFAIYVLQPIHVGMFLIQVQIFNNWCLADKCPPKS